MSERAEAAAVDREDLVVDGAFGGGYLVRGGSNVAPALVDRWPRHDLGHLTYHLHPRARLQTAAREQGPGRVVILGHPVDVPAGVTDGEAICGRVLGEWVTGGLDAAVHYLAYLGGRWTAVLDADVGTGEPSRITVVPDCQATQAVFYSTRAGIALASQAALVGETVGTGPDDASIRMQTRLREARATGVVFLPGTMTTYQDVLPLVPNHLLRIALTGGAADVAHERFWPMQERVERTDTARVRDEFIDYFREHTRLLCTFQRPVISLTGGLDSRTTLAAALPHLREDSFTFTYYNPRAGRSEIAPALDVFDANALSVAVGVQHRVLQWRQPEPGSVFEEILHRTFPVILGSVGAAHAMWADLPRDIIHLQSIGAELGTTFYQKRPDVPISPANLLQIVTGRTDLGDRMAQEAFGDYLDYAQFTAEAIRGYDFRDVFYWEQRMGKWGYQKYQDGDYSHRMLLPFNARGLIEIMQSLPYDQRERKDLLHALIRTVPALTPPTETAGPVPTAITWRDVVAARPRVRPRLQKVAARVRGHRAVTGRTGRSMP